MKNKKIILLGIFLILFLLIAAFSIYNHKTEKPLINKTENPSINESAENSWIVKKEKIEPEKNELDYHFKINEEMSLVFKKKNQKKNDYQGDIIFIKNNEESLVLEDKDIYSPHGFASNVFLTEDPNILIFTSGFYDMAIFLENYHYFDISKKEVLLSVKIDQWHYLYLTTKGKTREISFAVENCFYKSKGEKVELKGLNLDNDLFFEFKEPLLIECLKPEGIGSIHNPFFGIEEVSPDQSLSKLKILMMARERIDGKNVVVWQEEAILDLNEI